MKLFHSPASPYVRKVMVLAYEINYSVENLPSAAHPVNRDQNIVASNPTGMVPTAILGDGTVLYDSRIITRWLDTQHDQTKMYPEGNDLWRVLVLEATAEGLLDAALLARHESVTRPEEFRWQPWLLGQMEKIGSSLDALEQMVGEFGPINAGQIATACALGYLDFRFADYDWRVNRPLLSSWFEEFSSRASMKNTAPE